ncbi:Uncharacterised protein [Mycobacteroides abscessus subsp. abscessus]|nr:Uncharacterised protein [Mycobacteroides abscessus subsp. abscessus]SKU55013.1 Uncharacterised protein [Mycobacteroides abscessus subsp. abscessus]
MSTGSARSAAMEYSSRSPDTTMRVRCAPNASSCARTCLASMPRSPESMRTAPSSVPATAMAFSTPAVMS